MFCRQCGNELYDTDLFCNRCGAPVTPGPAQSRRARGAEGLTPAAKDSERIIDEFYRANRRKEETQSILDMEFAAIKGEPIDPRNLDAITYRSRDNYARNDYARRDDYARDGYAQDYDEVMRRESARQEFIDQLRPDLEKSTVAPQVANIFDEPIVEVVIDEPVEVIIDEPVEVVIDELVEVVIDEPADIIVDELILPELPDPDDEVAWNELLQAYSPALHFDPPEYLIYREAGATPQRPAPKQPTPQQPAQKAQAAVQPAQQAQAAVQPAQKAQAAAQPAQQDIFAQAESSAAAITASLGAFDGQKATINQEAQATLDMLDQLFADFDKPISESVPFGQPYGAANYGAAIGANYGATAAQPYGAANYGVAGANYGAASTNAVDNDLHKYASATSSAIATGKAIQKAVLDPEEEPPEEGFEDDEDFMDDLDGEVPVDGNSDAASGSETGDASEDGTSGAKDDATKKEKKGLFRRKSKEKEVEEVEEEPEQKSNVQKRSNVIVLNPEFLNPDEKATGKDTEDFKIASNMTHGVKAMDRHTPRGEDEEEHYEKRGGGSAVKKVILGILTALLVIAAVVSILITFGRDTSVGKAVLNFWDNIKEVVQNDDKEPDASEAERQEGGANGSNTADNNGGSADNNGGDNNGGSDNNSGSDNGADNNENSGDADNNGDNNENNDADNSGDNNSDNGETGLRRIVTEGFNAAEGGLGEAVEEPELTFDKGRYYNLSYFDGSFIFADSEWYKDDSGKSVTYYDAIFNTVTDYYTKLMARMNKDSDEVLELIMPDTKLLTDVYGIKADAIVLHAITKMEVGEMRKLDDNYFVLVRINEVTNDGRAASTYKRVIRFVADEEAHKLLATEIIVGD